MPTPWRVQFRLRNFHKLRCKPLRGSRGAFHVVLARQRQTATAAQIASITPNGQAPCKKP
jgi:hypothetical protein